MRWVNVLQGEIRMHCTLSTLIELSEGDYEN